MERVGSVRCLEDRQEGTDSEGQYRQSLGNEALIDAVFLLTMMRLALFPPFSSSTSILSCLVSRFHKGWSAGSGSGAVTSNPAPPIWPSRSATTRSSVLITSPRATLTTMASFCIFSNWALPRQLWVSAVRAQAAKTMSALGMCTSNSDSVAT
jgi:hypothetical protein